MVPDGEGSAEGLHEDEDDFVPSWAFDEQPPAGLGSGEVNPILVVGVATGLSDAEIGRRPRTVRGYRKLPAVEAAVRECRREIAGRAVGRLIALWDGAIDALDAGLEGTVSESLRASDQIFRHGSRLMSEVESQERMAALAEEIARLVRETDQGGDGVVKS